MQAYAHDRAIKEEVKDNVANARRHAPQRYEEVKKQHALRDPPDRPPLLPEEAHRAAEQLQERAKRAKRGRLSR